MVKKMALKNPTTNQHYSLSEKTLVPIPNSSPENIILHGIEAGKEIKLDEPFDKITTIVDNPDGTQTVTTNTVTPFSVYDYISENPQATIYTDSTGDIVLSTKTEPYVLYDEFGGEVEVLFYTDDLSVTKADLILGANWSPLDELEGDFEVSMWNDEPLANAQRYLEFSAIPKPQLIKLANPRHSNGSFSIIDVSVGYKKETRYLLTDDKGIDWYVWEDYSQSFVVVDASTPELILQNGMTHNVVNSITSIQWRKWKHDYVNIGIFLKDDSLNNSSIIENIIYSDQSPKHTASIEKGSFYILNTTAKIDLELTGNIVKGILSDDDLTRVQYRVSLNNQAYFPTDGSFTNLGDSPTNIELVIPSKDIIIDNWNTIKVEFQDFYGTTDYWQTQFIGTYSGLMFKDIQGDYYSSEIGDVLKYLDFGVIVAGQTTLEHEIILKNQYGYDVNNIHLYADTSNFPNGMTIEFSEALTPFIPQNELMLNRVLVNNDEISFFVRIKTELGATPNANGSFDIIVKADKV